ncbi:hypothetical protein N7592_11245 [Pseudomonas juntendi]|uniref:hypothetical protein n=1 Tax=Pseudomonas TaxID=286 RepID=UPI00244AA238|nr:MULTISPECIES: hypothetical protein [Pseudomonas]MDG9873771.1 hypothetical protein [Pseudomonas juntendi]MDQ2484107.1 hypothetical protein [Pseudomonas putida]
MSAEQSFRNAFERLKTGQTSILPKGSLPSQNNVAREAGCDPTALRKSRYPELIAEIKAWNLQKQAGAAIDPLAQDKKTHKAKHKNLTSKIADLKKTNALALAMLVDADAKILELSLEINRLRAMLPPSNITRLPQR